MLLPVCCAPPTFHCCDMYRIWESDVASDWGNIITATIVPAQLTSSDHVPCHLLSLLTPFGFLSQLIKNLNLFHKVLVSVLSSAGCGEKKRREEKIRKIEKKVVNVTEP